MKYYTTKKIDDTNAHYRVIFGERSNGKTYAVLSNIITNYATNGTQGALVRRYEEDFKGTRGQQMCANHVANGLVEKVTKGKWDKIIYRSRQWYFAKWDETLNKNVLDSTPFMYGFALASMEHDKSTAYPNITTILFDEFISRGYYLTDEFTLFSNVLSTIIRDRNNVVVYMCGNSVNKYNPYFVEMGLKHAKNQTKGTIDVYRYGESGLVVAVEYADSPSKNGKKSDVYFAFDNPKLNTITSGEWELAFYPKLPYKYNREDVIFTYFIEWDSETLQCEIINVDEETFTYIHRKTTPIHKKDDVVFSTDYSSNPYRFRWLTKPSSNIGRRIYDYFLSSKVFYQSNDVGEIVRNYLQWSEKSSIIVN